MIEIGRDRLIVADCEGCGLKKEIKIVCCVPGRPMFRTLLCCSTDCWNEHFYAKYGSLEDEPAPANYAGEPNFSERRRTVDRRQNGRAHCNECYIGNGRASVGPRHSKQCDKYRADSHTKQESTFSAYGDGPNREQWKTSDPVWPPPSAESKKIDYHAGPRTSYPIPSGYLMLDASERLRVGDMVWNNEFVGFRVCPSAIIGLEAGLFICAIRMADERKK